MSLNLNQKFELIQFLIFTFRAIKPKRIYKKKITTKHVYHTHIYHVSYIYIYISNISDISCISINGMSYSAHPLHPSKNLSQRPLCSKEPKTQFTQQRYPLTLPPILPFHQPKESPTLWIISILSPLLNDRWLFEGEW